MSYNEMNERKWQRHRVSLKDMLVLHFWKWCIFKEKMKNRREEKTHINKTSLKLTLNVEKSLNSEVYTKTGRLLLLCRSFEI